MTDKKYLAAFDVGGTKTDAVLFTKDGHITARVKAAGGIPLDIGLETAADNYVAILKELFAYAEAVKAACPQQLNIIYSNVPPIYGCAVEALYDFGIHADEQFRKNFMEDYNALTKGKAGK